MPGWPISQANVRWFFIDLWVVLTAQQFIQSVHRTAVVRCGKGNHVVPTGVRMAIRLVICVQPYCECCIYNATNVYMVRAICWYEGYHTDSYLVLNGGPDWKEVKTWIFDVASPHGRASQHLLSFLFILTHCFGLISSCDCFCCLWHICIDKV